MNKRKAVLVGTIVAVMCVISFAYAFLTSETIHTSGIVSGIVSNMEIYEDAACTIPLVRIDWGNAIAPGANITKHVWVKNVASYTMKLSFATSAWMPSHALRYLHLAWTGNGQTLASGSPALDTVLTLTVDVTIVDSSPLIGSFSFDITITGT